MSLTKSGEKSLHWKAFFYGIAIAAIIFIPFVIWEKGYFFFTGDFNVQQIPFYKLAHQAVRSGDIFWNWNTDLGANFIGSYSFYLLMSPFFWLTLPFPNEWVPFFIAPLLILKMGCASLTSYCYIRRFVKDQRYGVMGALLYAFSGFSIYNIFFNHFHEVIVFFPLLLIGMEELIQNNRRGPFAVAVAVNALVNYWFFVGEVVFVILYFFIRCTDKEHFPFSLKNFLSVAIESIIGVMISAFILLPSVLALLGNPRTTSDHLINGWNFWIYWQERRPAEILYSLFFPPDLTYSSFLFTDQAAKWSSLNAWLPMFSTTGVLAYLMSRKNDWAKKLLYSCLFIALVPGLNSLFILFNSSYYARWFYMPVLIMSMVTAVTLEDSSIQIERGFKWTIVATALFMGAATLTPSYSNGKWKLGLISGKPEFARAAVVAVLTILSLVLTGLLIRYYRQEKEQFIKKGTWALAAVIVLSGASYLTIGKVMHNPKGDWMVSVALEGKEKIVLPESEFARSDVFEGMDNIAMYWQLPNIQAFHSIVPVSIMEFYPEVGVKRDVSSKPSTEFYALRSLLSVKWLFIEESKSNQEPIPDFEYVTTQNTFNIYENKNFLPMGFTYDACIDRDFFDGTAETRRSELLLKAICLENDDFEKYGYLLPYLPAWEDNIRYDLDAFREDVTDRRQETAANFIIDNRGFSAEITLSRENLVFFSVPYEGGWSATVNGEPAEVVKANVGFMAVVCPEGYSEIRFDYMTPGLLPGLFISLGGVLILIAYLLFIYYTKRRLPQAGQVAEDYRQHQQNGGLGAVEQGNSGEFFTRLMEVRPEEPAVPPAAEPEEESLKQALEKSFEEPKEQPPEE